MNDKVKTILDTIQVGGVTIPSALLHFDGQADTFLLYSPSSESVGLSGDDAPIALIESWDVDIYSKTNYVALCRQIIKAFIDAGWYYRGSTTDTYDEPTKMYHRLLEFSIDGDTLFLEEGL